MAKKRGISFVKSSSIICLVWYFVSNALKCDFWDKNEDAHLLTLMTFQTLHDLAFF